MVRSRLAGLRHGVSTARSKHRLQLDASSVSPALLAEHRTHLMRTPRLCQLTCKMRMRRGQAKEGLWRSWLADQA